MELDSPAAVRTARLAPGPVDDAPLHFLPSRVRSYLFVLRRMLRDAPGYMVEVGNRYGDVVALSPHRIHLLTHPDHIKHVLQDNHVNYVKGERYQILKPLLGESVSTADGEAWRRKRRLVQPAFQHQQTPMIFRVVVTAVEEMLERWSASAAHKQPLNVRDELFALNLDIQLRAMFSTDVRGHEAELRDAFREVQKHINLADALNPLKLPGWLPTPANRRFARAMGTLDRFVFRIVEQRRRTGENPADLVSLLLEARDEVTGEGLSDRELRDTLVTMLSANDNLTDAVTWTWYLLAKNPQVRERLETEADSILGNGRPALEDLSRLVFANMITLEAMRLYPPAWVLGRMAIRDDVVGGYRIPANSIVVISPYVTHRLPEFWEHPTTFDPDRFSAERSAARPRFAFLPFGGGPRQCVGAGIAALQAVVIIAMAANRYRLKVPDGFFMDIRPQISLLQDRLLWAVPEFRASHTRTANSA